MFLFKKEHVDAILNGTKTQTRRLHKRARAKVGSIHQCRTIMMKRESCFALIRIKRVWRERLRGITEKDAQAEGGYTRKEFFAKIKEITKGAVEPQTILYCYEFEIARSIRKGAK